MNTEKTDAPCLAAFTRKAHRLLADVMFGRAGDQEKTLLLVRDEGEKIAATTEHQAVRNFIQRIMEDIDFYQKNPENKIRSHKTSSLSNKNLSL